jgi:hypothetical protein
MARFRTVACDACGDEWPEGSPLIGWRVCFDLKVGDLEKELATVDLCKSCAEKAARAVLALLIVKDWNEPTRSDLAKVPTP